MVGAYVIAIIIPLAGSGPLRDFALKRNGDLREEFGWDDLVHTVVQIRDSLPPDQQAHLGIATGNYGEYGAIEILGAPYGLPQPIGTTNSEYLRGYPDASAHHDHRHRQPRRSSQPTLHQLPPRRTQRQLRKACKTKRANPTPTSSSAARPASPGQSSGKTTRTRGHYILGAPSFRVFIVAKWVGSHNSQLRQPVCSLVHCPDSTATPSLANLIKQQHTPAGKP